MIRLHVLLVDDDTDTRQTVEAALALDPFFTVRDCASGVEALTAAVAWRPDLILLDVMMPDMDAPTVVARLRADKRTAPIPVVFLTALPEMAERQRYKALGAAGVITKPFDRWCLPPRCGASLPSKAYSRRRARAFCNACGPTPTHSRPGGCS